MYPPAGRALYFSAYDPVNGASVWRSDVTEAGTVLLRETGYLNEGNSGVALIEGFLASNEYRGRFLP